MNISALTGATCAVVILVFAGCSGESTSQLSGSGAGGQAQTSSSAGGSSSSSGPFVEEDGGGVGDAGADVDVPMSTSGCGVMGAPSGNLDLKIKSGGRDRVARVHLPSGYDGKTPIPVVINYHGRNSTASQQEFISGMTPKADAAGFIVVYPSGIGDTWNGGFCCGQAQSENVDDVGFTRDLLNEMDATLCIDKRRVFATGLSNGGFMANRVACELADRIAAIGPVAGQLMMLTCTPSRPVAVMHFHGDADPIVSYDGQFGLPGVEASLAAWAKRNGCNLTPTQTYAKGDTTCITYGQCTAGADVTLCTVAGGGHQWPGGFAIPGLGKMTTDIKATDAMWSFFEKHPMP